MVFLYMYLDSLSPLLAKGDEISPLAVCLDLLNVTSVSAPLFLAGDMILLLSENLDKMPLPFCFFPLVKFVSLARLTLN